MNSDCPVCGKQYIKKECSTKLEMYIHKKKKKGIYKVYPVCVIDLVTGQKYKLE